MTSDERLLWAMLAESEKRLASGWSTLDNHEVNVQIRGELRSRYGVNLDTLSLKAQGLVAKRVEVVKERIEKEKALLNRAIKLLEKPT